MEQSNHGGIAPIFVTWDDDPTAGMLKWSNEIWRYKRRGKQNRELSKFDTVALSPPHREISEAIVPI